MACTRSRVPGRLALAAALAVAACDSSDSGEIGKLFQPKPLVVHSVAPGPFVSYLPTAFTIAGSGFARGSAAQVVVTFRTDDGTPFADGTSAQAQVDGSVISDTEIQGTTPLTNAPGIWSCTVEVTDAFGSAVSTAPIAGFVGLTVFDIDAEQIPADQATPIDVLGLAFLPLGGNATIRFTATVPGAFPGGSDTLDVPGTIDVLRVSGVTPVLSLAGPVPAFVSILLDDVAGTPQGTSAVALTVFEPPPPIPVVVNAIAPPSIPLSEPTPFAITGSGFLGAGDPDVAVIFTAESGTPYVQGTATTVSVLGNATTDNVVVGTTPIGTSTIDVTAFVTVTRADGASGKSASEIALFTAPVPAVNTLTPSLFCSSAPSAFSISGSNLPTPQTATVRFRALDGTPFAGGSETADVTANITSALLIDGQSPPATVSAPFLADVTVILQSGTELPMGIQCVIGPFPQCQPPPGTLVVTTLFDSGPGSLRDVIQGAPPDSIIMFEAGLSGDLDVDSTLHVPQSVHIIGPGPDVIRIGAQGRNYPVFTIASAATATSVERLTIRASGHFGDGGGFVVRGGLTLTRCELVDHDVTGRGAAIFVDDGATLVLQECTLRDNRADNLGGCVFVNDGASAQAVACTFDDNRSGASGGAIATDTFAAISAVNCTFFRNRSTNGPGGGAIWIEAFSTADLVHCTFADNTAYHRGGAVHNHGTLTAANCIFSRNSDGVGDVEVSNDQGTGSLAFCLLRVGTGSGVSNGSNGNLVGTPHSPIDARLGALLHNGGPTRTMALRVHSPALDAADSASSVPEDQRGIDRPQGPAPDMGAYEETVLL